MTAEHFVYKLIAPRPTFPHDMTEAEATVMQEHAAYWSGLVGQGTAVAFGPVFDPAGVWGLAVVEAADEAEVRTIGEGDPAVSSGTATFDVFAMPKAMVRPRTEDRAAAPD